MRKAFTLFAAVLLCLLSHAITKTVQSNTATGWGTASNWSPSGVPVDGDEVIIPLGKTISVKGGFYTATPANIKIHVHGTLDFDPSGKLNLGNNSLVQLTSAAASITTNGSSSEQIIIGGGIKYNGSNDGTVIGPAFTTFSSPNSEAGTARKGFTFGVLPVQLVSFTAQEIEGRVQLQWITALEENVRHFELQKSINGRDWKTIATVQPRNTCACTTRYEYEDLFAEKGIAYYRLQSIDRDGSSEYSKIIAIRSNLAHNKSVVWSVNSASATLSLTLNPAYWQLPVRMQLLSTNGQVVMKKELLSNSSIQEMSALSNGMAILYLEDRKGSRFTIKIAK